MGAADPEAKDLLIGEMMSDYLEQAARDGMCVSLSLVCLCVCLVRVSYECLRFVLCGRVGVCVFALAAQARVLVCSRACGGSSSGRGVHEICVRALTPLCGGQGGVRFGFGLRVPRGGAF